MSQENVEIVRRVCVEWERGNFSTPAAFDPSIEVVWVDPTRQSRTSGLQELALAMQEFLDAWGRGTATAEQIIDAGDRVAVIVLWRARGKTIWGRSGTASGKRPPSSRFAASCAIRSRPRTSSTSARARIATRAIARSATSSASS